MAVLVDEHFLPLNIVVGRKGAVDRAFGEREWRAVGAGVVDDVVERAALRFLEAVAGQPLGGGVHVDALLAVIHQEDRDAGIVEHRVEPPLGRAAGGFGAHRVGDVDPFGEDAGHFAVGAADRLVDEVDEALLGRSVRARQQRRRALADIGPAALVDLVEQGEIALAFQLRQHFARRAAEIVAFADQPPVGAVDELEDVVRPADDRDQPGRLFEQLAQPLCLLVAARVVKAHSRSLGFSCWRPTPFVREGSRPRSRALNARLAALSPPGSRKPARSLRSAT
jgi:hypothetical protein